MLTLWEDDTTFVFTQKKRVVIVGGGFGGCHVAKGLQDGNYEITLVSKDDDFECIPSFPFMIGDETYIKRIQAPYRKV